VILLGVLLVRRYIISKFIRGTIAPTADMLLAIMLIAIY
jgi:hypothetical protein